MKHKPMLSAVVGAAGGVLGAGAMVLFQQASSPGAYPLSRHAAALASHLVFGLTVEGVRRALGRALSQC